MSRRFSFKPKAAEDLERIENYLARNASLEVAKRFIDVSDAAFERLAAMPGMGAIRRFASGELQDLRMWSLGSDFDEYLVFYRPRRTGGIEIVRVLHAKRDIRRWLVRGE